MYKEKYHTVLLETFFVRKSFSKYTLICSKDISYQELDFFDSFK